MGDLLEEIQKREPIIRRPEVRRYGIFSGRVPRRERIKTQFIKHVDALQTLRLHCRFIRINDIFVKCTLTLQYPVTQMIIAHSRI